MNMQKRSDKRSKTLHKEIAKKLKHNPNLWTIPKNNIMKWKKIKGKLSPALTEWEHILSNNTKEQILFLLEDNSEESSRLRSSSPFTGILNESERRTIFKSYSVTRINSNT